MRPAKNINLTVIKRQKIFWSVGFANWLICGILKIFKIRAKTVPKIN